MSLERELAGDFDRAFAQARVMRSIGEALDDCVGEAGCSGRIARRKMAVDAVDQPLRIAADGERRLRQSYKASLATYQRRRFGPETRYHQKIGRPTHLIEGCAVEPAHKRKMDAWVCRADRIRGTLPS